MKAIRVHEPGGAEALRYEDVPDPEPHAGEVVVRVEAAGVNFIDVYFREGVYKSPSLPFTLGQEAAGTVEAVGPGVDGIAAGDRVAWSGVRGTYAEKAVAPADRLVKLPDGVTARQGAAVMLQGMTAQYLACSTYPLKKGDVCLIHAAAGGVGQLLCQIAKIRGARVIGTTSTPEKARIARDAGADEVILYPEQDFVAETRRLTAGKGVQVVYDGVGKATFDDSLTCLAPRGVLALFGASSGAVPPVDPMRLAHGGSLFLTRPSLATYSADRQELLERAADVFDQVRSGALDVRVGARYPLAEAARAHEDLEARRTTGKALILPR